MNDKNIASVIKALAWFAIIFILLYYYNVPFYVSAPLIYLFDAAIYLARDIEKM